ncbi:MAG: SDR family NAD(P)-dependent oxidoreductase [Microbacterium sp.]|uniref:SDR family NAD(P)-dependent oxidoreductase n=1 Tax=Microbacterium sp. TaxID=51671 RepID=UPI0039E5EFC1
MTQRVALVTGAGKGMGREIVRQLASRGIHVVFGVRRADAIRAIEAETAAAGGSSRGVLLDVTDAAAVAAAADSIRATEGRLDILVNNAGIAVNRAAAPGEVRTEDLRRTYEVNVFGLVAVTNAVLPLLLASPAGRIVNQSTSMGSLRVQGRLAPPYVDMAWLAYDSSKAAVNEITIEYAKQLRGTPVLVNATAPGQVSTDLNGNGRGKTAAEGAELAVMLATLPAGSPTARLWDAGGPIDW